MTIHILNLIYSIIQVALEHDDSASLRRILFEVEEELSRLN